MTEDEHEWRQPSLDDEFGLNAVRELLRLISESDVTEIQIKRGDTELHIKRGPTHPNTTPFLVTPSLANGLQQQVASPLPPVAPFQQLPGVPTADPSGRPATGPARAPAEPEPPRGQPITAPMVGTFYSGPNPKDPPFIHEGDTISPGDRIGIIETMKMMNEIESEVSGRVSRVLVQNGQPVEYGQPLMIVEPI
jgi:acetyl-CoA carboxylase biotin carboxyl carrier protein